MTDGSVTIYKFWSATDELLYVGITSRGLQRWQEHMATKPWWEEVHHATVEHVVGRRQALERERQLIRQFRPRYNVVHNTAPVAQYVKLLDYRCAICGEFGRAEEMFIELPRAEVDRHDAEMKEWEERYPPPTSSWSPVPWERLANMPRPASWRTVHNECDPDPEGHSGYYIDGRNAATHEDLLYWTAHLMEKRWFAGTDWDVFISAQVYQDGGRP
ncbi:MAG: GIY-YIG nuclease family protein [Dehalococcoidia bacterium]|nr:GIY-YIG nuclease family protein [Dehalococcoidia bacterium]